ncbi:MAG: hypothetical protein WD944_05430 [Steroidobacteraceae bacterium]
MANGTREELQARRGTRNKIAQALLCSTLLACARPAPLPTRETAKIAAQHYQVTEAEAPTPWDTSRGRYRVYAEENGAGDEHLFSRDLASGDVRPLTAGPGSAGGTVLSPDGKRIAYVWGPPQGQPGLIEIRIVGTDGSVPRVLLSDTNVTPISRQVLHEWSPDGKYVAATVHRKDRSSQLTLFPVAGGSARVLKTVKTEFQWNRMRFSRDGRFVAYDLSAEGGWAPRDIFLVPVDGGSETSLVRHPANDLLLDWTHDGQRILFASNRSGQWDLWAMVVSGGQAPGSAEKVYADIGPMVLGGLNTLGPRTDGSYYYRTDAWENDVYLATRDPATDKLGPPTRLAGGVGHRTSPQWSHDGRYLAYVRGRGTAYDPFDLAIRLARTGEERQLRLDALTRHGGHGFDPQWSPDGRFILVDAREKNYQGPLTDSQGLYRIDVQTGNVRPLVYAQVPNGPDRIDSPAWSTAGEAIFERRPPTSIVSRDLGTGEEKVLYVPSPPAQIHHWPTSNLRVSPDGAHVAFVWTDAKSVARTTALMVLPTAGGQPRDLVRAQDPETISLPAWMPDSRHVLYALRSSGEKPDFELWRVSAGGGEPQKLGLKMDALVPFGLSVHPDGTRIVFTAGTEQRMEVWVLKDFLPALKSTSE